MTWRFLVSRVLRGLFPENLVGILLCVSMVFTGPWSNIAPVGSILLTHFCPRSFSLDRIHLDTRLCSCVARQPRLHTCTRSRFLRDSPLSGFQSSSRDLGLFMFLAQRLCAVDRKREWGPHAVVPLWFARTPRNVSGFGHRFQWAATKRTAAFRQDGPIEFGELRGFPLAHIPHACTSLLRHCRRPGFFGPRWYSPASHRTQHVSGPVLIGSTSSWGSRALWPLRRRIGGEFWRWRTPAHFLWDRRRSCSGGSPFGRRKTPGNMCFCVCTCRCYVREKCGVVVCVTVCESRGKVVSAIKVKERMEKKVCVCV